MPWIDENRYDERVDRRVVELWQRRYEGLRAALIACGIFAIAQFLFILFLLGKRNGW